MKHKKDCPIYKPTRGNIDSGCTCLKPEGVGEWEEEFDEMLKTISFTAQTEELYQKGLVLQTAWTIIGAGITKDIKQFIRQTLLQEKAKWNKPLGISEWKKMGEDRGYFDYLSNR